MLERCRGDAYCDTSVSPYLCRARLAEHEECQQNFECSSQVCRDGHCFVPFEDGAPCENYDQCISRNCFEGQCITAAPAGSTCHADQQCATYRCFQNTCIAIGQEGAPCSDDLECSGSCFRGMCIELHRLGDACDRSRDCLNLACYQNVCSQPGSRPAGAECSNESECRSNRCVNSVCIDPKANGESCDSDEVCLYNLCFQGACGLPDGELCGGHEQCRSGRCPNHYLCAAPLADGESCMSEDQCLSWTCVDGICFTRRDEGESCASDGQCQRGFCDPEAHLCSARRLGGEHCTVDQACRSFHCDLGTERCGKISGEVCSIDGDCQGFCDGMACADRLAIGADCQRDAQCLGYCVYGRCAAIKPFFVECRSGSECSGGICDSFYSTQRCRGPGQCFFNAHCPDDSYCNEDHSPYLCAPKKADGESCREDGDCLHYCVSNFCRAKKPNSSTCQTGEECAGGACRNQRCETAGACYSDFDCDMGLLCHRSFGASQGYCGPKLDDGSGCEHDEECASGFCSDADEKCKKKPTLGDACLPFECTLDSYCRDGRCQARKAPGSSCDDSYYMDLECLGPSICRNGTCEKMSLECEPAQIGEMCTLLMACADDAYCDLLDKFTCAPRYQTGASCQTVLWRANTCFDDAYCGNGTCQSYSGRGESCASIACDPSTDYCDSSDQTCHAKKYRGERCKADGDCLSDDCGYDGSDRHCRNGPCKPVSP